MRRSLISLFITLCILCCVYASEDSINSFDRCEFGRHLIKRCVGRTTDPVARFCPKGFFCYSPIDGPGPCCQTKNPCSTGVPYKVKDDAVTCSPKKRCPYGYECISEKNVFAVCCPTRRGK